MGGSTLQSVILQGKRGASLCNGRTFRNKDGCNSSFSFFDLQRTFSEREQRKAQMKTGIK